MMCGTEWLIDALGCAPELLASEVRLRSLCNEITTQLQLHVVGQPLWHVFPPPGGVTGLVLLSESHLACHTFPEFGLATFNLYCCRPRAEFPWSQELHRFLSASNVQVRRLERGTPDCQPSPLAPSTAFSQVAP